MQWLKSGVAVLWMSGLGVLPRECQFEWPPDPPGQTGGSGGSAGATGGLGGSAGAGEGGEGILLDPVLGCDEGVWPERAIYETLPPNTLRASAMSGDGEVVVGWSSSGAVHPTLWTHSGVRELAELGYAEFSAANCDGTVLGGRRFGGPIRAFFWRESAGTVDLLRAQALELSANGEDLLCGYALCRSDGTIESLGADIESVSLSADAQVVHGLRASMEICGLTPRDCNYDLMRWTRASGWAVLHPALQEHYLPAAAADGTVATVAPEAITDGSLDRLQLWHLDGETEVIQCPRGPCLPQGLSSHANVIITGGAGTIWSRRHGFRDFAALLAELGADTRGASLSLDFISDDARVIVGTAYDPETGEDTVFRAQLPKAAWR